MVKSTRDQKQSLGSSFPLNDREFLYAESDIMQCVLTGSTVYCIENRQGVKGNPDLYLEDAMRCCSWSRTHGWVAEVQVVILSAS